MSDTEMLWGVGQWEGPGGQRVAWEVSHAEIRRDIGAATGVLAELGIGAGRRVLWCSMLSEAAQHWPFVVATMLSGAQFSCADATSAEAARVAMFLRLMEYRAVFGITGALLDGLDELGFAPRDVFGAVEILGARPDAFTRLVVAGLTPHHFVLVGPAVALGCAPGAPARLAADEWRAEEVDGYVAVSSLAPRAATFVRTRTSVRGRVVDGDVVPDVRR